MWKKNVIQANIFNAKVIAELTLKSFMFAVNSRGGHIKLISGRTGLTIRTIPTPSREEVFVPVQFLTQKDGTELLLISTGRLLAITARMLFFFYLNIEYTNFDQIFRWTKQCRWCLHPSIAHNHGVSE
jgi:hypothetical protein